MPRTIMSWPIPNSVRRIGTPKAVLTFSWPTYDMKLSQYAENAIKSEIVPRLYRCVATVGSRLR